MVLAYLGETREVYKREVENMGGIYLQVDGLSVDCFVVACHPRCFVLDFAFDIREVGKSPVRNVMELGPFKASGSFRRPIWIWRSFRYRLILGHVDELENERPSRDDTASPRQEIAADDVLKDRRLSGRLRANHNLG